MPAVKSYTTPAGNSASVERSKPSKGKGKLTSLTVEVVDGGGYVVSEHYDSSGMDYRPPTKRVASSIPELDVILDDCLGLSAGVKDKGKK